MFKRLKCRRLQLQAYALMQSEEQIHVMYGLSRRTFDKVVDNRCYEQLAVNLFKVQYALVGVDHVFQVGSLVGDKRKVMVGIIVFIQSFELLYVDRAVKIYDGHYAAGEASAHGYEVYVGLEARLQA